MVLTESKSLLGMHMPPFKLPDVFGKTVQADDYSDVDVMVVLFICGHCPYVLAIEDRMIDLAKQFSNIQVQFIGICSNNAADYPEDRPEALRARVEAKGYSFPYLLDESQQIAKAFDAVCTPDIYVFNKERQLAYHGRFDDNWKDPHQVSHASLHEAIALLLEKGEAPATQYPSMGCSIKWKKA